MTSNQFFTLPRFFNLFKEEASSGYKMTLIVSSVVFIFLLILFTIIAADRSDPDFHQIWYPITLLAGGFYFTSISFNELNKKEQRMNYLSIPASIFEKFSLKLLVTTIGYVIITTALYWVFAQVMNMISQYYFDYSFWTFNPFDDFYLLIIKIYLVVQSVFLLGAATFNRFSFFKTLLTLFLITIVIELIGWILFRVTFAEYFETFFVPKDDINVLPGYHFRNFIEYTAWPALQFVFWYVLAPVLWVVAYFKLKEREV